MPEKDRQALNNLRKNKKQEPLSPISAAMSKQ